MSRRHPRVQDDEDRRIKQLKKNERKRKKNEQKLAASRRDWARRVLMILVETLKQHPDAPLEMYHVAHEHMGNLARIDARDDADLQAQAQKDFVKLQKATDDDQDFTRDNLRSAKQKLKNLRAGYALSQRDEDFHQKVKALKKSKRRLKAELRKLRREIESRREADAVSYREFLYAEEHDRVIEILVRRAEHGHVPDSMYGEHYPKFPS